MWAQPTTLLGETVATLQSPDSRQRAGPAKDPGLCLQIGGGSPHGGGEGFGHLGLLESTRQTQIRPCQGTGIGTGARVTPRALCWAPPRPCLPHRWAWGPPLADGNVLSHPGIWSGGCRGRPPLVASGDGVMGRLLVITGCMESPSRSFLLSTSHVFHSFIVSLKKLARSLQLC